VFDYPREGEGYVLLARMEGGVPGYLSYSAREGEVICLFESVLEAEQFYMRWRARIPGEGWGAVRLEIGELMKVLLNFDLLRQPATRPRRDRVSLHRREFRPRVAAIGVDAPSTRWGARNRPPESVPRHALAPPLRQAG